MNNHITEDLINILGDKFDALSEDKQLELSELYRKKKKNLPMLFFLWFLGFHYAYIGKWCLFFPFLLTFGGLGIWWVIDLYRISTILGRCNDEIAKDLLKTLR